jgi:enoyl-CoA hydratase/carnithine racemase
MILCGRDGGVTTLTLHRPELGNALGPALVEALICAVNTACQDGETHTLVLRGAGKNFCTGLDLSDLDSLSDGDLLLRLVRIEILLGLLWHAPIRTVAVAHGRTWGTGADLFAVCEQRVALEGASFRFPGAQFGIVLGTRRLAERVGADVARALVVDGGTLDATEALHCGLAGVHTELAPIAAPMVDAAVAAAVRAATRADHRDADLAALVRSAAVPGLQARVSAYRRSQLAARGRAGI